MNMGTLRFLLALLVLFSHAGGRILGFNPGVVAVVVFYIISGYVMSALMARHFSGRAQWGLAGRFYIDRVLRLYPQYLFYALAVAGWLYTMGHPTPFLNPPARIQDWFNNLFIVPLNFFMFNAADRFTLVPPAWSLGAEVLFYLALPWLFSYPRWAATLALASFGVQTLAWHGVLNSDWWGYRLLPGVLWLFLCGMALNRWQHSRPWLAGVLAASAPWLGGTAWVYLSANGLLSEPYHREVLLGVSIGVPLVYLLTLRNSASTLWWDAWLGNLSYGIFLNHFLFIWALGLESPATLWQWMSLLGVCILSSFVTYVALERPVLYWRRRMRLARIQA